MEFAPADMTAVDFGGVTASANAAIACLLSRSPGDLEGQAFFELVRLERRAGQFEKVAALRRAIADGRLRLDGQPIVDIVTGNPIMHEVLVRRVDPGGLIVSPEEFIPLAEQHGVICEIDRWVLGQAVGLAAAGRPVAINVSARTMCDPDYAAAVKRLLGEQRVEPGRLTFELTETARVASFEQAESFALTLGSLGCKLALDDFGTGHSCLADLKQLPAQYLKIDRGFVRDILTNLRSRAIVEGIVKLAQCLGQQTIAEGVADRATLELLRALGVDLAQGFHIARPEWMAGAVDRPRRTDRRGHT